MPIKTTKMSTYLLRSLCLLLALLVLCTNQAFALDPEQRRVIDSGAGDFNIEADSCSAGVGTGGFSDPLLGVLYPSGGFSNEAQLVAGAEEVIRSSYANSPWIGRVQWIFDQSEAAGVNPLFIIVTGGVESTWGDSRWGRSNNNYFGIDQGHRSFPSPEAGIQYFIDAVPEYVAGNGADGRYRGVENIYEYSSIHQAGSIVYPGQPFDPNDVDSKPGNTMELFDDTMGVYVSWDPQANDAQRRPEVNPRYDDNIYNPLVYYRLNIQFMNRIAGTNFPEDFAGSASAPGTAGGSNCNTGQTPEGQNTRFVDGFTIYKQADPAWGSQPYGAPRDGDNRTIASSGCGPSAMAMIITTLTGQRVTPAETAAFGMQPATRTWANDGGSDGVLLAERMAANWGLEAVHIGPSIEAINQTLRSGGLVIVSGRGGLPFSTGGHFVVIRAVTEDGKWLVGDSSHDNVRPDTSTTPWEPQEMVNNFTAGGYSSYAITNPGGATQ